MAEYRKHPPLDSTPVDAVSDEQTLVEAARSDPNAFSELYLHHQAPIFRYLLARAGNEEDALDMMQQTFLQALEHLPEYRDRGLPFSAWLFRIARNAATDLQRRSRPASPWDLVPDALWPVSGDTTAAAAVANERRAALAMALGRLTEDQRELLALRFGSDLTFREIGHVVGRSEGAVRKQIHRVLRTVREHHGT